MLKQLYLAIEQKLMAITDDISPSERGAGVSSQPLFKHFDLWNRQVEFIEQETPFETPAVFVEFVPLEWHTDKSFTQNAIVTVRLHIVTPWYANTAANVPGVSREVALSYLDIPSIVFRQLHGQRAELAEGNFNALVRTGSVINHDHERFIDSVEEYQCHLKDYARCDAIRPPH